MKRDNQINVDSYVHDPAYEAYRDRDQKGRIEVFMDLQDEKAKKTKPNTYF